MQEAGRKAIEVESDATPIAYSSTWVECHSDLRKDEVYDIRSNPKGAVLILSDCYCEQGMETSDGQEDYTKMEQLWKSLGFATELVTDLNGKKAIIDMLQKFVTSERMRRADVCVIVVMSHGQHGDFVVGKIDARNIVEGIVKLVSESETLRAKPKFLFFQMCRAENAIISQDKLHYEEAAVDSWFTNTLSTLLPKEEFVKPYSHWGECGTIQCDATTETTPEMTDASDIMIAVSTQPGHVSSRDNQLIDIMADVFSNNAKDLDLNALMDLLKEKYYGKGCRGGKGYKGHSYKSRKPTLHNRDPTMEVIDTFRKKLYLFPVHSQKYA